MSMNRERLFLLIAQRACMPHVLIDASDAIRRHETGHLCDPVVNSFRLSHRLVIIGRVVQNSYLRTAFLENNLFLNSPLI